MLKILYKTTRTPEIKTLDAVKKGSWIHVENPSPEELVFLKELGGDEDLLEDALDPHEVPRREVLDNTVYVYLRVPYQKGDNIFTMPIMIAVAPTFVLTLCQKHLPALDIFEKDKIKFSTNTRISFFLRILEQINATYETLLNRVSRNIRSISVQLEHIENKDIIKFVHLETLLNDLLAALVPMGTTLHKLSSEKKLRFSEEQKDILEDVLLSNGELRELVRSNLRTIVNIREGYSTIMGNNLNRIMKVLTVLTIVLTIPTIVSSLYGMNVPIPLSQSPYAFWGIAGGTVGVCLLLFLILVRKKWI